MRLGNLSFAVLSLAFTLFAMGSSAAAQDVGIDLPALHVITCDDRCTSFTPAVPILHAPPPAQSTTERSIAGLVMAQYVIGADGAVRNIDLLQLQGPRSFADRTIEAIRKWTFEPAKLNGKPIDSARIYRVKFDGPVLNDGARKFVIDAYNRGAELILGGQESEALSVLNGAGKLSELNFYERSMMAYPLALVTFKKQDYLETRRIIGLAEELGTGRLNPVTEVGLWELRIESDLLLGDMVDANWSYEKFSHQPGFKIDSPAVKLLKKANTTVNALPLVTVEARIPSLDEGDVYWFTLYRNTFSFQTISGSLEKFQLVCNPQMMESKITDTAQWRVPKSWGQCGLFVHGAPGSTFRILQTNS